MKNAGMVLVVVSIGFLLYWNFAVAGTHVSADSWQYAYDGMPGSQFYPLIAGAIGYGLMKMGEPEEAQGELIEDDEEEPAQAEAADAPAEEEASASEDA